MPWYLMLKTCYIIWQKKALLVQMMSHMMHVQDDRNINSSMKSYSSFFFNTQAPLCNKNVLFSYLNILELAAWKWISSVFFCEKANLKLPISVLTCFDREWCPNLFQQRRCIKIWHEYPVGISHPYWNMWMRQSPLLLSTATRALWTSFKTILTWTWKKLM